jgi:uncharacterized protein with HEPN domain
MAATKKEWRAPGGLESNQGIPQAFGVLASEALFLEEIAGTRDKVIHNYLGVDVELIWNVARALLP